MSIEEWITAIVMLSEEAERTAKNEFGPFGVERAPGPSNPPCMMEVVPELVAFPAWVFSFVPVGAVRKMILPVPRAFKYEALGKNG